MEPPSTCPGFPAESTIRVISDLPVGAPAIEDRLLSQAVRQVLISHSCHRFDVTVLLTTDEEIRRLNQRFRQRDESTDVLTFADTYGDCLTGDIAIAVPFALRQAQARGIALADELVYLAIHGALHLCGFDDEEPRDRDVMQRQMQRFAGGLAPLEDWHSLHGAAA